MRIGLPLFLAMAAAPAGVTAGLPEAGDQGPANVAVDASDIHLSGFETIEPPGLDGITSAHNSTRVALRLQPLTWSAELAASAQAWVSQCVDLLAPFGLIDSNQNRGVGFPWYVGENIFASGGMPNPDAAVTLWEQEAQNYNYDMNSCTGVCVHYTQLVWATTLQVGCGVAICPDLVYEFSLVCDYGPGGNTGGRPY